MNLIEEKVFRTQMWWQKSRHVFSVVDADATSIRVCHSERERRIFYVRNSRRKNISETDRFYKILHFVQNDKAALIFKILSWRYHRYSSLPLRISLNKDWLPPVKNCSSLPIRFKLKIDIFWAWNLFHLTFIPQQVFFRLTSQAHNSNKKILKSFNPMNLSLI